ncbi:MAG: efflux RND transporter periplasmic adaptor subunit [Alphaproteobacteria bacterium]|nr:efflux RND transporter periplasmic adaptor subunit [Alphaproteobacteria bacterium]
MFGVDHNSDKNSERDALQVADKDALRRVRTSWNKPMPRAMNSGVEAGPPARAAVVAAMALVLSACGGESGGQQAAQAIVVPMASPVVKEVTVWDEYVGRFEAVNRVEIRPRVSGYLEAVHFQDGALIEKGDALFTIDPRPFRAALDGAQARAESARTAARLAAAELDRAKRLLESRAGSQEEYDRRLQAKQAADAEVAAANAAVTQAELELEFTDIRSPISGRASRDFVNTGNLVSAQTSLLTTIVSIDPIHFVFTGSEQDYLNYSRLSQAGNRESSRNAPNPVRIKLEDQEDYLVEGVMNFVDNALNPGTGTIEAQAIVENDDGFLTPGMFGRLRLYGRDPFQATLIPDTAIQFDQSRQFVWVMGEGGAAEMRTVRLGRLVADGMRIVEEGLSPADKIVVAGFARVRPGAPLQPAPDGPPGGDASVASAGTDE